MNSQTIKRDPERQVVLMTEAWGEEKAYELATLMMQSCKRSSKVRDFWWKVYSILDSNFGARKRLEEDRKRNIERIEALEKVKSLKESLESQGFKVVLSNPTTGEVVVKI